jgi:hypothetical protein
LFGVLPVAKLPSCPAAPDSKCRRDVNTAKEFCMKKNRFYIFAMAAALIFAAAFVTACGRGSKKDDPQAIAVRYYELKPKYDTRSDDNPMPQEELDEWYKVDSRAMDWTREFGAQINSEKGISTSSDAYKFIDTLTKLDSGELTPDDL